MAKGKTLDVAQKFYIEQHLGSKSNADIASDLNVPVSVIQGYAAGLPIPAKDTSRQFETHQGSTSLTKAGSMDSNTADAFLMTSEKAYIDAMKEKETPEEMAVKLGTDPDLVIAYVNGTGSNVNTEFMSKRLKDSVHRIDPTKPIR